MRTEQDLETAAQRAGVQAKNRVERAATAGQAAAAHVRELGGDARRQRRAADRARAAELQRAVRR